MRTRHLRTILLAALSLALAAALFLAYQYRETKTTPILITGAPATPAPAAAPAAITKPDTGSITVGANREVEVSGGGKMRCEIYDDEGFTRGRLIADEWRPLGEQSTKLEVVKPQISIHTPGGQIIELAADRGVIERKSASLSRLEVRSAELRGAVHITIDRLTDAQRKALPEGSAAAETDRFIQLTMDDLFFDLEFARVETEGPFQMRSAEAEIEGRGLSLRYNELESRVEELNIASGKRIIVWNLDDRFRVPGLNDSDTTGVAAISPPAPAPEPSPAPTPSTNEDDAAPLLAEDEPRRPRERPTDVYTAIFEGAVNVIEYKGKEAAGRLTADYLRILFDFSQRERELARQAPPNVTTNAAESQNATPAPQPALADVPANRIELTWSGPLKITSERLAAPTPEGEKPPQRVHLTATGERVLVDDGARKVECRKLSYRNEAQALELTGTAELPAHVTLADGGELFGREITLDREQRRASARGPEGRLIAAPQRGEAAVSGFTLDDAGEEAPLEVRFEQEVIATFDLAQIERFDPITGQTRTNQREVLQTAVFTGQVRMVRGEDRFRGERIEIDFGLDPNGKQYPTQVRAFQDVLAAQGSRYISAQERLLVDFELQEKATQRAPFDVGRARQMAIDQGQDVSAVDWEAVREHYESRREYTPGIKRLEAVGTAEVRDPQQELEIDCDILECRFRGGREIQSGLVTPRTDGRAFVALGAFSISAPQPIPFDALAQTVAVEGPGRMTFPSEQDIDGRSLEEPLIVSIQWKERMAFDGNKNEAIFRGEVCAETERSRFDCGSLRIDFENQAPVDEPVVAASTGRPENWWLLQPILDRATRRKQDEGMTLTGPAIDKRPIYLYATGKIMGQTENHDAAGAALRNRVTFSGPMLAVDLRQRQMLIDGPGNLLIEDYSKATRAGQPAAAAAAGRGELSPFGRLVGDEPSQTLINWEKSMAYHDAESAAEFNGDVSLMHSTGAKMKRAAAIIGEERAASGKGREAELLCQTLTVRFARDAEQPRANAGTSPMSGTEVDAFIADGQVHFKDSGISAIANRVEYARDSGALEIIGSEDSPAELFDQRKRFNTFKGPRFTWNRKTNQILAPKSRGRMN